MKNIGVRMLVFLTGCFVYSLLEIYEMHVRLTGTPLWQKCLIGSVIITSVEFTVGVIVNIILRWNVWDYSDMPFNVLGQICLPFTVLWFFLCIPAYYVCRTISRRLSS